MTAGVDRDGLRAAAEAVSDQGPWFVGSPHNMVFSPAAYGRRVIAEPATIGSKHQTATFIASTSPSVVLALLDALDSPVLADALGYLWANAPARRAEIETLCRDHGLMMTVDR